LTEKLVGAQGVSPVAVQQYRKLAATLQQVQAQHGAKVVMVASAIAGEGKTLTAVNLALTLSNAYRRRVLLVDADLRKPEIHRLLQVQCVSGLNEALKSPTEQRLPVIEVSPRLFVLPAGQPDPDPIMILTSEQMQRVIKDAAEMFDRVILDTPPLANLADTHLRADMADVSVLVAAAGKTPSDSLVRAVEILERERVVGVVLNQSKIGR